MSISATSGRVLSPHAFATKPRPQLKLGVIHGKRLRRFEVVRRGTLRVSVRLEPIYGQGNAKRAESNV
jgi:hypothetical protein